MIEIFNRKWPASLKLDEDDWCNIYVKHKWTLLKSRSKYYLIHHRTYDHVLLHRLILKTKLEIDHINGDTFDNRKCNLRAATDSQNAMNKRKCINKKTSKYKGVSFDRTHNKWCAKIYINYKSKNLGLHESEVIAAEAYNAAAKRLFGEYAKLNIIETN